MSDVLFPSMNIQMQKRSRLNVKLTNKNTQTAKCASYEGTESNPTVLIFKHDYPPEKKTLEQGLPSILPPKN